jgi:bifunctional non-homologous end joining protein LigD
MIIEVKLANTQDKSQNKVTAFNRRGLPCGAPEVALQEAELLSKALNKSITLDGESLGDKLHVFDVLNYEEDTTSLTYNRRLEILETIFSGFRGKSRALQLVSTFRKTSEKKKLLADLKKDNAEGIVLKEVNSHYQAGRPSSKGNHQKFKFVESLSAIVTKVNDKRSVGLGVYSPKESNSKLTGIGNVSIPINHEIPNEGDIVEIRYLYAIPVSNALYQPVYLGKRDDLEKEDCNIRQLKYKA